MLLFAENNAKGHELEEEMDVLRGYRERSGIIDEHESLVGSVWYNKKV